MEASKVSEILKGKKSPNGEFLCRCPGHDDKQASFSVKNNAQGKIVMTCFAGCKQDDLFLKVKELYEAKYGREDFVKKEVSTKKYKYQNEKGEDVLQVVRTDFNDGSKKFFQEKFEDGKWQKGKPDNFSPYRFPEWKDLNTIVIVEGEKCADACWDNGIAATCFPGGSTAWRDDFKKFFDGRDVVIIPDNDTPGEEFAQSCFDGLCQTAIPLIVRLPNLEIKEDIVEWFEKGNTKQNLFELAMVAKNSPLTGMGFEDEFSSTEFVEEIQKANQTNTIEFGVPFLDDVWGGILPDDLVVLSAKSGFGKTQMAMHIAKSVVGKGKKVAFFALESFKKEIGMRAIYTIAVDEYFKNKSPCDPYASFGDWVMGNNKLSQAMNESTQMAKKIAKEFWAGKFFTYYIDKKFTVEEFEKRFHLMSKSVDLIILDHLHYIAKLPNQNMMDHISEAMSRIKTCVNKFKTPVLLISHLRKEDGYDKKPVPDAEDLHGSSDIFKIATKVILMGRPLEGGYDTETGEQTTYFRIPKDRLGQIKEWEIGKLMFNSKTQKFNDGYEMVKLKKTKEIWEAIELTKKPYWMNRSKKKQEDFHYDL